MKKVDNKENYLYLFENYKHSRAVIFSALENQYPCDLYVNKATEVAVLFSNFGFAYVTGDTEKADLEELEEVIFKTYLKGKEKKELILIGPNQKWYDLLDGIFKKYKGIKDTRKFYAFNREAFRQLSLECPEDVEVKIEKSKAYGSQSDYQVSHVYKAKEKVAYCAGFMIGNHHVEIDVKTEEAHQKKGYAKLAAFHLIKNLKANEIPDWCCWAHKTASQNLALSLGFEWQEDIPVHIWVEEVCGKL